MDMRKIAIVPATLALGLFVAHTVKADAGPSDNSAFVAGQGDMGGDGKNGDGGGDGKNGGGDTNGGNGGGDGKNGGGDTGGGDNGGNGGGDGKNGGGDNGGSGGGDGKNGGGDTGGGDNGGGDHSGGGDGKNGDGDNGGGDGKNGGGDDHHGGDGKNGDGDHNGGGDHHGGGHKHVSYHFNYGTGNGFRYRNVRCMVNGHRFWVRVWSECVNMRMAYSGGYTYGGGYVVGGKNGDCGQYVTRKRHGRRVRVMVGQPAYQTQGYVGGGYGYTYGQQPVIRYYKPASRAAVMQAQRRAAKAAAAYGYDAGGYGAGYSYGAGYGYGYGAGVVVSGGGYGYGDGGYVVTKRGKKRLRHFSKKGMMVIQPTYIYNPNVVYQSGSIITKDGGY